MLVLFAICLLAACGGQADGEKQTEAAQSEIFDEDGFETVGEGEDTKETAKETSHTTEEENTEASDKDGGAVELPKLPIQC